jgi:hypothetical protein
MKRFAAVILLAGCVEPQPNPAAERLMAACNAGDTQACAVILEQQQRYREGVAALGASMSRAAAPPPMQPMNTGMKVCPNGMIVQQYYLC